MNYYKVVIIKKNNDLKKQKRKFNNTIFQYILHSYLVKIEELNANCNSTDFTSAYY
jgi:hypothetical protein